MNTSEKSPEMAHHRPKLPKPRPNSTLQVNPKPKTHCLVQEHKRKHSLSHTLSLPKLLTLRKTINRTRQRDLDPLKSIHSPKILLKQKTQRHRKASPKNEKTPTILYPRPELLIAALHLQLQPKPKEPVKTPPQQAQTSRTLLLHVNSVKPPKISKTSNPSHPP
jgi:hypothetical protein